MRGFLFGTSLALVVFPSAAGSLYPVNPTAADLSHVLIFEEPVVALGDPAPGEVRALAQALDAYVAGGRLDRLGPVLAFLDAHPSNPWALALRVDIGLMHRHVGQVSQALAAWEEAWAQGKGSDDPRAVALSHRALGELLEAYAGLGNPERLKALVDEAQGRPLSGLITEKLAGARESLSYMKDSPTTAFRCGPMALAYLKAAENPLAFAQPEIEAMLCTPKGTSLAMNQVWAGRVGLQLQMAKRTPGSSVPFPSVIHFRTGHFAALTFAKDGRYLIQDPFLGDTWMSGETLDREASGYALVPSGPLPSGWMAVSPEEGGTIWGKGAWGPGRPDDTRQDSHRTPSSLTAGNWWAQGLGFHSSLVSLHLELPIVEYEPVRGPDVSIKAVYNQREYGQPQIFDYANLGAKWTFSYLSCIKDDTTNPDFNVSVCQSGGGGMIFQSLGDGQFQPENLTQAALVRHPDRTYEIDYPDGRKEFYDLADRAWGLRRLVLTHIRDAFGNEVRLTWDPMLRLTEVTDAAGKVTHLKYTDPTDPLKLSEVVDPFGRTSRFEFDAQGRLSAWAGVQGKVGFEYGPGATDKNLPLDFLRAMATPAGRFEFLGGEKLVGPSYRRWLEAKGPDGRREYLEGGAGYAYEIPPEEFPRVPEMDPAYHPLAYSFREGFYWNADALGREPEYPKGRHIRWGRGPGGFASGLVLSEKNAGGPRHWFVHAGDFGGGAYPASRTERNPMTVDGRLKVGRELLALTGTPSMALCLAPVFDGNRGLVTRDYWFGRDGKLQAATYDFDTQGRRLREMDPNRNARVFQWGASRSDLQGFQDSTERKKHYFSFDDHRRLTTWRGPQGTVRISYGSQGGPASWKRGSDPAWSFAYDGQGRLQKAVRGGHTWSFAFDSFDRLVSMTDPAHKVHALSYDAWNRSVESAGLLGPTGTRAWPAAVEAAFASVVAGVNGPIIRHLVSMK